jgi:hypothetical protein
MNANRERSAGALEQQDPPRAAQRSRPPTPRTRVVLRAPGKRLSHALTDVGRRGE